LHAISETVGEVFNEFTKRGFNPGIRDATKAALAIGRKIAVPPP
jgi:hypothetical protein